MNKQALRALYKSKRNNLSKVDIEEYSAAICSQVINLLANHGNQTIHCFLPIAHLNEVNTWPIVKHFTTETSKCKLVTSISNFTNSTLKHIVLNSNTEFETNKYGIIEPKSGVIIEPEEITSVIIPLLACDTAGNRLGYGKGFYDRFLAACKPQVIKMGVSFFAPSEIGFDTNSFDIPLNLLVTPEKVFTFNQ